MKKLLFILILLFISTQLWSQGYDQDSTKAGSIYNLQKNSVYFELGGRGILGSVTYDRITPLNEKNAVVFSASVGLLLDLMLGVNFMYGKTKNFVEVGTGLSVPGQLIVPQVAYRYQGDNGFLFRASAMYFQPLTPDSFGDFPWIGLSFGYSF